MKEQSLLVLFSLTLIITSCSLEDRIERREERIMGAWRIDKAWYKSDRALFRRNVRDEFGEDIIRFFDNYEAVYEDWRTGELFFGDWTISAYRGDDDIDFLLDMEFYDDRGRLYEAFLSNVTQLTRQKLNITVHEPSGVYTFRLRRFD